MNDSMVKCEQCGSICNIKDGYCKKCWKKLPVKEEQQSDYIIDGMGQAELENFIEKNSARYISVFKKNNGKKFFLSFNWAAFFFCVSWLLYRKMYKYAIIAFLISGLLTVLLSAVFYIPYLDEVSQLNESIVAVDSYLENGGKTILTNIDGSTYSPDVVTKGFEAKRRVSEIETSVASKTLIIIPIYCILFGLFGDALYKRYIFKNIKSKDGGASIISFIGGTIILRIIETVIFTYILPIIAIILLA